MSHLGPRLGRSLDGLIGSDFIEQFVVEVDYEASDAGFMSGDIVRAVDGRTAGSLSLSDIVSLFRIPGTYTVLVRRGNTDVTLSLTTRPLL